MVGLGLKFNPRERDDVDQMISDRARGDDCLQAFELLVKTENQKARVGILWREGRKKD